MPDSAQSDLLNRSYRPDIDGIRAIAILSVVLFHAGMPGMSGGFTGVDIFFVISGYLIGGHIYSEARTNSFSFLRFYKRRAKRILPAFYGVLAFSIVAALVLLSPYEAAEFGKNALAATLSASNLKFWKFTNYFDSASALNPMLMTWSLGVEEQFYVIVPIFMVLVTRFRRNLVLPAIVLVCVLSFVFAEYELVRDPRGAFFLLPGRAWELGVGVALAVIEMSRKRGIKSAWLVQLASGTGFLLMLAPMALLKSDSLFPGVAAMPSVLGAALVIATPSGWINRRALSQRSLVFIGKVSYSWYLWHWPMLSFLRIVTGGSLQPWVVALAVPASLGVAIASYYIIEQPFRRSTREAAPLLVRYALVSLAALAVCAALWRSQGVPRRYAQLARVENAIPNLWSVDPCLSDFGDDKPHMSRRCYDASGTPTVALWGDSHADALGPGLRKVASHAGYGFVQLDKSTCRPLKDVDEFDPLNPHASAECLRYNREALHLFETDRNIRIVVLAGHWESLFHAKSSIEWLTDGDAHRATGPEETRAVFVQALSATIASLQASGKQVIVMGDVPDFDFDPLEAIRTHLIPARHGLAMLLGVEQGLDVEAAPRSDPAAAAVVSSLLREATATLPGSTVVELKQGLCDDAGQCIYRREGQLFYRDNHHLSPDGSSFALRNFRLPPVAAMVQ